MSASTIAAARLRHQVDRSDQHQRLPGALGLLEEARVRSALLAFDSGQLSLPEAATFEPLLPTGTDRPILDPAAVEIFASHTTFDMPRFGSDAVDVAHRFCLRDGGARLNQGLKKYALHMERYARRSGAEPERLISGVHMLPHPRDRSASGVHISNRGGFQSYPDLFDYFDLLDCVQAAGLASGRLARGREKTPTLSSTNGGGPRLVRTIWTVDVSAKSCIGWRVPRLTTCREQVAAERGRRKPMPGDQVPWPIFLTEPMPG